MSVIDVIVFELQNSESKQKNEFVTNVYNESIDDLRDDQKINSENPKMNDSVTSVNIPSTPETITQNDRKFKQDSYTEKSFSGRNAQ